MLIGLAILFALGYSGRLLQKVWLEREIVEWEQRVEAAQLRNAELQEEAKNATKFDVIDKIAREELGMAKEGDEVVIIFHQAPEPLPVEAVTDEVDVSHARVEETLEPKWRQWLNLFATTRDEATQ
ncbi:MAG: septum formation initiator family protein [Caldilineaceae bacterium]|nr:septum formation initiator family protein [Caldilineaceae bacterium]